MALPAPTLRSIDDQVLVYLGDCLDILREIPDASVHAVITDPPYGLSSIPPAQVTAAVVRWASGDREFIPSGRGFMDKSWDAFVPPPAVWDECLRILKPGGHLLAFSGTRTVDLMGLSIRLAGFDVRDSLAWMHGQGFPKGQDIGARIDQAGADGSEWTGWSNALKPAFEPILMAQKPFTGPLYRNVMAEGVGGLNIDATRIAGEPVPINRLETWSGFGQEVRPAYEQSMNTAGRYPANVFLDEDQAAALDAQTAHLHAAGSSSYRSILHPDSGASRFFYVAKPSKAERPMAADGTRHPTTKPLALMRQLVRLVTPAGGTIVEPFAGSGTTVEAALLEGFHVIAVEREPSYVPLIAQRIDRAAHVLSDSEPR